MNRSSGTFLNLSLHIINGFNPLITKHDKRIFAGTIHIYAFSIKILTALPPKPTALIKTFCMLFV
ncbi:hypothetical protein J2W48_003168 [Flavobacterium piscis]|uniref:Uncharacterized protein n=1 Tax=Flavobacterium piscis TaxID=1114874 RepID=A0ABU1YAF7_9FLAO|nr:hypothetical protein [Flavobacterium piscis]